MVSRSWQARLCHCEEICGWQLKEKGGDFWVRVGIGELRESGQTTQEISFLDSDISDSELRESVQPSLCCSSGTKKQLFLAEIRFYMKFNVIVYVSVCFKVVCFTCLCFYNTPADPLVENGLFLLLLLLDLNCPENEIILISVDWEKHVTIELH